MRLIKPSYDIWDTSYSLERILEHIERVGRVCYKSEDRIKYDKWGNSLTATPFVNKLIESGHLSVLEHGTIYLKIVNRKDVLYKDFLDAATWYYDNPYSRVNEVHSLGDSIYYVTTNYRVLVENNRLKDLRYLCEPAECHERRVTVHFTCDLGVWNEFIRHRTLSRIDGTEIIYLDAERKFSFAQESTRYCNYSKDKFGHELTFILPPWVNENPEDIDHNTYADILFREGLHGVEKTYFRLLKEGWTPQQARAVLPKALKTELVMTGFVSDWKHFLELRTPANAHPQARELASPLHKEFIEKGLIK